MKRTIPLLRNLLDEEQGQQVDRVLQHFHAAQDILHLQPRGECNLPLIKDRVDVPAFFSAPSERPAIVVTSRRFSDNWFSHVVSGRALITVADWQVAFWRDCGDTPVAAPDANMLASFALAAILATAECDDHDIYHTVTRGCLFDFCEDKSDRALKIRAAYICSNCTSKLAGHGISSIELDAVNSVLERVRLLVLGRRPQPRSPPQASDDEFVASAKLPDDVVVPPRLIEACKERSLSVMVGSGMSLQGDVCVEYPQELGWNRLPSWSEVPQRLSELVRRYTGRVAPPREAGNVQEFLADMDYFRQVLGEHTYYPRAIFDVFSPHVLHAGRANRLLFELPLDWLITTNYDFVLQYAAPSGTPVYTWREARQAREYLDGGRARRPLLKIHGCASRPDTVVLTGLEYERLRAHNEYISLLRFVFESSRAILFIGFGLSDPYDLDLAMQQALHAGAAAAEQFAVLPDARCSQAREKFRQLHAIGYSDHSTVPSILAALIRHSRAAPGSG